MSAHPAIDKLHAELQVAYNIIRRLTDSEHRWYLADDTTEWQQWHELVEDAELVDVTPVTDAEHKIINQARKANHPTMRKSNT
jgi:hypothetical protein